MHQYSPLNHLRLSFWARANFDPMTMMVLAAAGTAVSAAGTIASGQAADRMGQAQQHAMQVEGQNARTAAEYEAKQLDIHGKEEFATGQREAQQLGRQKRLALSSLQAKGAASGFSATDPSNLAIADEIEKYGSVQEGMALYGGSARERDTAAAASSRRFSGQSAYDAAYASGALAREQGRDRKHASYWSAAGTILGGASTMASRFGTATTPPKPTNRYG